MRGCLIVVLFFALSAGAAAEQKDACFGDDPVVASGVIDEVRETDPAAFEIILDTSTGACAVDAINVQGGLPDACVEGRRVTGEGVVQQSRDGTWTWLETDEVRCE